MLARLSTLWEQIRTSLWAVPLAMSCVAVAAAFLAIKIEIRQGDDPVWFLYSGSALAPEFLSNLVSAMITMTTLAISITMVVLALAAQQLGPRLIRTFMGDRRTQLALGLFTSTVIYLLLVLRSIDGTGKNIPNLAVTMGTGLVLLSMVSLLLFVHHLARSIIADNIIERVGNEIDVNAERLLPAKAAKAAQQSLPSPGSGASVALDKDGYVQAVDQSALVKAACEAGCIVRLLIHAGDHVVAGLPVARVQPAGAGGDRLQRAIEDSILIGSERTPVQDIEFSIRQMVELGLRALSPGINDPFTAMATLDRLQVSIARIMRRHEFPLHICDADGEVRLVLPNASFEGLVEASFGQFRHYAAGAPAVLLRLAECIAELLALADERHRAPLQEQLDLVMATARRHIEEPKDLKRIEDRVLAALPPA
jgi:uncharacterized membrane protein